MKKVIFWFIFLFCTLMLSTAYGRTTANQTKSVSGEDRILVNNPPTNLTAYNTGRKIKLFWHAPAETVLSIPQSSFQKFVPSGITPDRNLISYKIYKNDALVATVPSSQVSYDDPLIEYSIYSYKVTALYSEGESVPSNIVTLETANPNYFPAASLRANSNKSHVNLEWEAADPFRWISWCNNSYGGSLGSATGSMVFTMAIRFTPIQLLEAGVVSRYIKKVKFRTGAANSSYQVAVWTGGSIQSYNPGALVSAQTVSSPVSNGWNEVTLEDSVEIQENQEVWIGVAISSNSGFPAGHDDTLCLNEYGNLLYMNGEWTTIYNYNNNFNNNWLIMAYVDNYLYPQTVRSDQSANTENCHPIPILTRDEDRSPDGYNIYRNEALVNQTPLSADTGSYLDANLEDGFYSYKIKAVYPQGESAPVSDTLTVSTITISNYPWAESFENDFPGNDWAVYDMNNDFLSWMHFDSQMYAHAGLKSAVCLSKDETNPSFQPNDWLISPRISINQDSLKLMYWVAASSPTFFNEHYAVYISNNGSLPENFSTPAFEETLTSNQYVQRMIDLSQYNGQNIYVAFRHFNTINQLMLRLDDIKIQTSTGSQDIIQNNLLSITAENYPNPFNPETTIQYYIPKNGFVTVDVYNVRGQIVKKLVNENQSTGKHQIIWKGTDQNDNTVGSGVYFYKIKTNNHTLMKKMLLVK